MVPFPVTACRPLTSLAAKREKLQATVLLPVETRNVAPGNAAILSLKLSSSNRSKGRQVKSKTV